MHTVFKCSTKSSRQLSQLKKVKLSAKSSPLSPTTGRELSHLDIRPTIEKLLGLPPLECRECGSAIQEFFTSD